jgi:hypothetical protein
VSLSVVTRTRKVVNQKAKEAIITFPCGSGACNVSFNRPDEKIDKERERKVGYMIATATTTTTAAARTTKHNSR